MIRAAVLFFFAEIVASEPNAKIITLYCRCYRDKSLENPFLNLSPISRLISRFYKQQLEACLPSPFFLLYVKGSFVCVLSLKVFKCQSLKVKPHLKEKTYIVKCFKSLVIPWTKTKCRWTRQPSSTCDTPQNWGKCKLQQLDNLLNVCALAF